MAKIKKRRAALTRGGFVRVQSWDDLACTRAVFRDSRGEFVRLTTGVLYSDHKALTGRTGCILDAVAGGAYREIRMDNGETVIVPTEILVPLNLRPEEPVEYRKKRHRTFNRFKSLMEANGIRKGSNAAMVFT